MVPREHRLKRKKDIERVFKKGTSLFNPICGLRFTENNLAISRFAVVVGTKVSKHAVERNRMRRQYREVLRKHLSQIVVGKDIILLPSRRALSLSFEEKEGQLLEVLQKAELIG